MYNSLHETHNHHEQTNAREAPTGCLTTRTHGLVLPPALPKFLLRGDFHWHIEDHVEAACLSCGTAAMNNFRHRLSCWTAKYARISCHCPGYDTLYSGTTKR
jgi:hypothetical protein